MGNKLSLIFKILMLMKKLTNILGLEKAVNKIEWFLDN